MSRGESRSRIIDAARGEFAEHGFAGARVGRVARRAGLNKQLIYYYFGSKAGLYAAATASDPGSTAPPTPASDAAPDALRAAIATTLAALGNRPDVIALLVDRRPDGPARAEAATWMQRTTSGVSATVSLGQGLGYFRDDVDPDRMARQIVVLCVGFLAVQQHLGVTSGDWARETAETMLRATTW